VTLLVIVGLFAFRVMTLKAVPAENIKPDKLYGPYTVKYVIDGDTIILHTGDKVRLKGIDAPELHHPVIPAQRFGQEAKKYLENQIKGKQIMLEFDTGDSKDMYDRALAYVFLNNTDINGDMVRMGYAYAYVFKPHKREKEYKMFETEAREKKRGLWNYTLKDGRVSNIVNRYGNLTDEGKKKFDQSLDKLIKQYPVITGE